MSYTRRNITTIYVACPKKGLPNSFEAVKTLREKGYTVRKILKGATKAYAAETQEKALEDLKFRRKRRYQILSSNLSREQKIYAAFNSNRVEVVTGFRGVLTCQPL